MAKARYELMNRSYGEEESVSTEDEDVAESASGREMEYNKVLENSNLRATDIHSWIYSLWNQNQDQQNKSQENTKEKLLECVYKYKEGHCNCKGDIKEDNINCEERQGLRQLKKDNNNNICFYIAPFQL